MLLYAGQSLSEPPVCLKPSRVFVSQPITVPETRDTYLMGAEAGMSQDMRARLRPLDSFFAI